MRDKGKKSIKTTLALSAFGLFFLAGSVNAQTTTSVSNNSSGTTTTQTSTSLVVPQYDDSTLAAAGCDKNVWNTMLNQYVANRTADKAMAGQIGANFVSRAPSATNPLSGAVGSCFGSALSTINSVTATANTIRGLLTGNGFDSSQLMTYAEKLATQAACSQVNAYISETTSTSGLGSTISTFNGTTGSVLNSGTNIGGVNTGSISGALGGSGYTSGASSSTNIPYLNTTTVGNGVVSSVSNLFK